MNTEQIQKILAGHTAWLRGAPDGDHANLTNADLTGVDLTSACFRHAILTGVSLTGTDLRGADLIGATLLRADLTRADLRGADLRGADLRDAFLVGADLTGAHLTGACLAGANLTGALFTYADLTDAVLINANLTDAALVEANLTDADLTGVEFTRIILTGTIGLPDSLKIPPDTAETRRTRALAYRARHPDVPVVEQLDSKILSKIRARHLTLDMNTWHGGESEGASVIDFCGTTHCQAGSAIHLAGAAGYALERQLGSADAAGRWIYLASTGRVPDFFAEDDVALADIERHAAEDTKTEQETASRPRNRPHPQ